MPRPEILNKVPEDLTTQIETLLQHLAEHGAGKITIDPSSEFKEIKMLLDQAGQLEIEIDVFEQKFTELAAKYYDEIINRLLGQVEEKIKNKRPEVYLILGQLGKLIEEAKGFKIDMPEVNDKYQELEKLAHKEIVL